MGRLFERASLSWPIVLAAVLAAGCDRASPPEDSVPQAARDVSQPEGWADDLAMPTPKDLNPDPNVLEINLEARVADVELLPGTTTPAWTYNGTVPGPMIRGKVGDRVIVHFKNSLPEETTIHWHGIRVPNEMDGAPGATQQPIATGDEFRYEFVLKDAGTYWYHPHTDSSAQVGRGLYGAFVVDDPGDPKAFGDDLVMILSDIGLDE
ncbi:MAG TPA: multicopper oxidase domain-containing protein, partial [Gammaproteobacteria bacterium]|nr:multicopper oxidase domain-containing protein [Gammaproteobacteria bacterium]